MAQRNAINVNRVPEHMQADARAYVEEGKPPGGFLMAVLCNDLMGAFSRADGTNEAHMKEWTMWLFNDAPSICWGDEETVNEWIESGGLNGR